MFAREGRLGSVCAEKERLRSVCDDQSFWMKFLPILEEPQPAADYMAACDDQFAKKSLNKLLELLEGDIIREALLTDVDPSPAIPLQCSPTPPNYISP